MLRPVSPHNPWSPPTILQERTNTGKPKPKRTGDPRPRRCRSEALIAGTHRFSRRTRHYRAAGPLVRRRPVPVSHPDLDCASGRSKWFARCLIFCFDSLPDHQHPVSQTAGIIGRGLRAIRVHVERVPATTRDQIQNVAISKIRPRGRYASGSSCAMVSALVSDVQELRFR